MKTLYIIILFIVTLILMHIEEIIQSKKKVSKIKKRILRLIVTIVTALAGGVAYDYAKGIWLEESKENGLLRGSVPYYVETNEQYGNFCVELESKGEISEHGFQISIGYVNSEYSEVIVWDYSEPAWFNFEPMEYEITIMSPDGSYNETYPCTVSKDGDTQLTLPIS